MKNLGRLRAEIDHVDARIIEALAERRRLVDAVGQQKAKDRSSLRSTEREEELLARRIADGKSRGLDAHFVTRVFHEIIDDALRLQELQVVQRVAGTTGILRVAYQGVDGAYSQLAAQKFFSKDLERTELIGCLTFEDVVREVESGTVDYGFLPIENTTAGAINQVYDLLLNAALSIVGEEVFRVDHCLLALEDVPLFKIRRILSHPQALTQCAKFLSKLRNCQAESVADTALAVRKVKDDQDLSQAAIASAEAGREHGLHVIQRNIADQDDNFTRFLVLAKQPVEIDDRVPCKTSLVIATSHDEGALLRALDALHQYEINMTKLESRPRPGMPFEYLFYLDFEGNMAEPRVQQALERVRAETRFLKVLGSYPMQGRARTVPPSRSYLAPARQAKSPTASGTQAVTPAAVEPKVSYKLASRTSKSKDTTIRVRGVTIGGDAFVMMAGPCAVESREQIRACARAVKEAGAHVLRGGCFKPRTSPYSFQGLGFEGLEMLVEAGREFELPIITEVLSPEDVRAVARHADILQIGARNMQNFSLLRAVGQVDRPVMLKRGMSATIDEFLNAAEYILEQGNQQVILCERGIRTFETSTRNTLDLGAVPILKQRTHLPIIVDPSHAAGERALVVPLAMAARAVGPHGMMVEIHPNPEEALSDGPQALRFPEFQDLVRTTLLQGT